MEIEDITDKTYLFSITGPSSDEVCCTFLSGKISGLSLISSFGHTSLYTDFEGSIAYSGPSLSIILAICTTLCSRISRSVELNNWSLRYPIQLCWYPSAHMVLILQLLRKLNLEEIIGKPFGTHLHYAVSFWIDRSEYIFLLSGRSSQSGKCDLSLTNELVSLYWHLIGRN